MSGLGILLETSPDLRYIIEVLTLSWPFVRGTCTILNVFCVLISVDACEKRETASGLNDK